MDICFGGTYLLGRKIGAGSFDEIHIHVGTNMRTNEKVAIKLESTNSKYPQLIYESKIYRVLAGGVGIPNLHWYGVEGSYNVMITDILGPSLEELFNCCQRKFSLKTILMVADQMINRVEWMHMKNFLHRNINPENFVIGFDKTDPKIHVINFGLAKRYRDSRTQQHIPKRENKKLTGTALYASINTHLGIEQSRRDDVEAVGYVLMYFNKGSLPWQGVTGNSKNEKYCKIMGNKIQTPVDLLCRGFPSEFMIYLNSCKRLGFEDRPDYTHLRGLFKALFFRAGYRHDFQFDWRMLSWQQSAGVQDFDEDFRDE